MYPPGTRWVSEEFFQKLIIITIRCVQRNITFLKKTITTIPNLRNHDSLGIEGPKKKGSRGGWGRGEDKRYHQRNEWCESCGVRASMDTPRLQLSHAIFKGAKIWLCNLFDANILFKGKAILCQLLFWHWFNLNIVESFWGYGRGAENQACCWQPSIEPAY